MKPKSNRKKWILIVIGIVVLFFVAVGCIGESASNEKNDAKKEVTKTEVKKEDNVPKEYKKALNKAASYSKTTHMSKQGIYDQLTSDFEEFTPEAAQYAIDNLDVDYNQNALNTAKSYEKTLDMSKSAIYTQLTSEVEKFTPEEAQYAIDHLED